MPQADRKKRYDAKRAAEKPWRQWYRTSEWRELRRRQLERQPWCQECRKHGRKVRATVADHVKRHRGSRALFYDPRNLQSLCATCHNTSKRQTETLGYSTEVGADGLPLCPDHPFYRGG